MLMKKGDHQVRIPENRKDEFVKMGFSEVGADAPKAKESKSGKK